MKIAFVTPSFRGDFERCELLCESTRRFLPRHIEHFLLVDRRDLPQFRRIAGGNVRVIEAEAVLPWWIFRVPGAARWWASLATPPIRNWLYQQLLKIGAFDLIDAEVLHFVDSDVTLTRPFSSECLVNGGLVRFHHAAYEDKAHLKWLEVARNLLDLRESVRLEGSYVGNFVTWRRSNVAKLIEAIEQIHGCSWVRAIARQHHFSEYSLYGVFVDHVIGLERSGHIVDSVPKLHLCWKYDLSTPETVRQFIADTPRSAYGLMIHSKYRIPVNSYKEHIHDLWARTELAPLE